jgi:hypothetical protein
MIEHNLFRTKLKLGAIRYFNQSWSCTYTAVYNGMFQPGIDACAVIPLKEGWPLRMVGL